MRLVALVLFLTFSLLVFNAGLILPGAAGGKSREQKVWAKAGSTVVLPCHLSPRKTWKRLPEKTSVLWKRHGGSAHQEPHMVLEVGYSGLRKTALPMRPRVSVQDSALRNGNFSLRIDPVQSEDAGLYEAWVTYNTEVQSCQVKLGVITVTLSPPSPVIENEPLLLNCNSSHQASLVETCWFHNRPLGPTSRTLCFLHGALSILRPAMSDAGSWRCQLRYSDNEIISATYNLQILGFDGPSKPVVYAAAGSAADLPCTLSYLPSTFGISVETAHWSHLAGEHLQGWDISQNSSSRNFHLHLPVVGPSDAGQYRCAVSVGSKTIRRDVTLAVVTVTPSIQGPVSEGSHLLLICSITHPQGHERFQWKHIESATTNSKLAGATSHNLEGHRLQMGPALEIPQVSQKDIGTWECSVHGPMGRLGAAEYELQITGAQVSSPPTIFSGQVTFGLTLALFFLLTVSVLALALQKRVEHCYGSNLPFPASESCNPKKPRWIEPVEHSLDNGDGPPIPPVKYCTPEFYHDHQHLAYKLISEPRGLALILSNVHFSSEKDLDYRAGGEVDCISLEMLFKHLGYQVTVLHDQTAQEMQNALERFSKLPDHQDVDSCIVALLSHGVEGGVYGSDGKLLQLQEAFRLFDNANCPYLQNKPKMFFIQACRGDETDRGVDQRDGKGRSDSPGCEESDANKEENLKLRLPTCSDMICGYACLKGTAAMRNTKRGSWYVQALTSVFAEDSQDTHVADMLVKVNRQIKQREGYAPGTEFHRCKEMSEYCSTLCRDLYLFPGYLPAK